MEGCGTLSGEALIAFIILHRSSNPRCSLTLDIPNPLIPSYYFHVYIMKEQKWRLPNTVLEKLKIYEKYKYTYIRQDEKDAGIFEKK